MLQMNIIKDIGGIIKPGYKSKYCKEYNRWDHIFYRLYLNNNIIIDNDFYDFENFIKWYNETKYDIDNESIHMYTINGHYTKDSIIFIPKKILNTIQNHDKAVKGYSKYKNTYSTRIYDCLNNTHRNYIGTVEDCINVYKYYKVENSNKLVDHYKDKLPSIVYDKLKKLINSDDYVKIKN